MNLARFAGGALALALLPAATAAAQTAPEPPETYVVRKGDNLYELAERYLRSVAGYRSVQRINRVRQPRRLPVGSQLRIPAELLKTEPVDARLAAFRGDVRVQAAGRDLPVAREMPLREGYVLATGPGAFLTVTLPDESRITLPSNSRVRIEQMRRVLLTGAVQRRFAVEEGRTLSVVPPAANPKSRYEVVTPITVSAVRGTEFRANYDPAERAATLEVVEGTVGNRPAAAATEALVPAGFGTQTTPEGTSEPRALLPAPKAAPRALTQDEPELAFRIQPPDGAAAFRAQIATDAGFIDVTAEADAREPVLTFPSLRNGTYFIRFTALDQTGLEGLPATYAFERRLNSLALEAPAAQGRQFLFRWRAEGEGEARYRFVISREGETVPVVDQAGLADTRFVVTRLPPGAYSWRVHVTRRDGGRILEKWSPPQRFEVGR